MDKFKSVIVLLALLLGLALTACGGGGDPVQTVERYLQAKAASDGDTIRQLLCSEMEAFVERETRTFESVSGVEIQDMACEQTGDNTVSCTGKIVAEYGAETTEFPLTAYRVVQEDGEWKWCGESAR